ncbi:T4SS-associated protein LvhB7 [Legionella norrlandica]|nr:T4SS-associated protein LvhB7 [Legionella norrlandica]
MKWLLSVLMIALLSGCSKLPDLDSPCHHFGQYCPQYPINDEPIMELTK